MLELDLIKTEVRSVYGGQDVVYTYDVIHTARGIRNSYVVEARVRHLDNFNIELEFSNVVETPERTNEETLIDQAILDLCNDERY